MINFGVLVINSLFHLLNHSTIVLVFGDVFEVLVISLLI